MDQKAVHGTLVCLFAVLCGACQDSGARLHMVDGAIQGAGDAPSSDHEGVDSDAAIGNVETAPDDASAVEAEEADVVDTDETSVVSDGGSVATPADALVGMDATPGGDDGGVTADDSSTHADTESSSGTDGATPSNVDSCWYSKQWSLHDPTPLADAREIVALWGASPNDVWESRGMHGLLHHFDGTQWTDVPLSPGNRIFAIAGSAPNDVWAVGTSGTIAHWDGLNWSCPPRVTRDNLRTLWMVNAKDAWAAGDRTILHWDGTSWSPSVSPPWAAGCKAIVQHIFGSGPADIWANTRVYCDEAYYGQVWRWNGAAWQKMLEVEDGSYGVGWASGPDRALVAQTTSSRSQGELHSLEWNGSSWAKTDPGVKVNSIWGSSANDVWKATQGDVRHWSGGTWQSYPFVGNKLSGISASDVWLYGNERGRIHWQGTNWTDRSGPTPSGIGRQDFVRVTGDGSGVATVLSRFRVLQFQDGKFRDLNAPELVEDIVGTENGRVLAVARDSKVYSFDGLAWSWTDTGMVKGRSLTRLWYGGPNDIWATGSPLVEDTVSAFAYSDIVHWDGSSWTRLPPVRESDLTIDQITGSGPENVWFVGLSNFYRWNGQSLLAVANPGRWNRLWVAGTNDVYAYFGGSSADAVHWNGSRWSESALRSVAHVVGTGSSDRWIIRWPGATESLPGIEHLDGDRSLAVDTGLELYYLPPMLDAREAVSPPKRWSQQFTHAWTDGRRAYFVTDGGMLLRFVR